MALKVRLVEFAFIRYFSFQAQQEHHNDVYVEKVNEEDLEKLYDLLEKQREGLEHLTNVVT